MPLVCFRLTEVNAELCMQAWCCLQNTFNTASRAAIQSTSKHRKKIGTRVAEGNSVCPFNPESTAIGMLRFLLMVQVIVIKTAVAGIGPYNRKWPGPPETADRYGLSCCEMHCCGAIIYHMMHTMVAAVQ